MSKIEIKNVNMSFGKQVIFENINMTLQSGQSIGLVGENGSGKSVLFKLIAGLLKPNSGEVIVNGYKVSHEDIFVRDIGALIEEPAFIASLSGRENLELLASINHIIGKEQINQVLESVGLSQEQADKKAKYYSLGMKKKLGIAQAIMEGQNILLLDEPMNALDEDSVERMSQLFLKKREEGALMLLTSHHASDIERLCDTVYHIREGKIELLKEQ